IALGTGQLDVAHLDALIGHGDEDVWALLAALDRHRWHGDSLRPGGEIDFDIDVLARPKLELLVGKCGFGGDRAGRTVDTAINEIERTAEKRCWILRRVDTHYRGWLACRSRTQGSQIPFRQRETHA